MFIFTPLLGLNGEQLYFDGNLIVANWGILPDGAPAPYNEVDYAEQMLALLPEGPAWPRDDDAVPTALLRGLAWELSRIELRVAQLVLEANPGQAGELLADWERVAGLPDPCVTVQQTVVERREAAVSKVTYGGGQSRAFFIALAQSLGYTITIDEFRSAAQATAAGISFTGTSWAHTWRVNVPEAADVREFRAGSGAAGEPLRVWGNEALECRFQRLKPAHTVCLFSYA